MPIHLPAMGTEYIKSIKVIKEKASIMRRSTTQYKREEDPKGGKKRLNPCRRGNCIEGILKNKRGEKKNPCISNFPNMKEEKEIENKTGTQ
ncbi:uncharacterized protein VTP21DRAFT_2648 [Calcarisporiella thermophila]|uniref:uncharacterized protein n=1 Tax=Calcarisporiella thermophila TaxID=911321 RepID=UPI003743FAAA